MYWDPEEFLACPMCVAVLGHEEREHWNSIDRDAFGLALLERADSYNQALNATASQGRNLKWTASYRTESSSATTAPQ